MADANKPKNPDTLLKVILIFAATASFLLSVGIFFLDDSKDHTLNAIYIGIWVPSILAFGGLMLAGKRK